MNFLLIPIYAICNRIYGSFGIAGKAASQLGEAATFWFLLGVGWVWLPVLFLCQYLTRIFGKGKWFPSSKDTWTEDERLSFIIDPLSHHNKTLATGLAWAIPSIPKYLLLSYLVTPWAILGTPLMLMMGVCYLICFKLFPNKYDGDKLIRDSEVPYSELLSGAWMGAIDIGILCLV